MIREFSSTRKSHGQHEEQKVRSYAASVRATMTNLNILQRPQDCPLLKRYGKEWDNEDYGTSIRLERYS